MFLVFQIILNKNFPRVNDSSFCTNVLLTCSFCGQKGNLITNVCLSSKSQSGMMFSSVFVGGDRKSRMTESTYRNGKPTSMNFFLMRITSCSKSEEILFARCSSPLIALRLYRFGTLELQNTGILVGFT